MNKLLAATFLVAERVGSDPAKCAFYGAFCDFSSLNDLGIG